MESAGVSWSSLFPEGKSKEGLGRLWAQEGVESVCVHVTERQRMPFGICQESLLEKQGVTLLPQQPNHTRAQTVYSVTGRESPSELLG